MKFQRSNVILLMVFVSLFLSACQLPAPTGPTPIPSVTETAASTPSPSPTSLFSPTPAPELRSLITVTPPPIPTAVAVVITPTPTLGPKCYVVKEGETLTDLIYRAGYGDLGVLNDVKTLNGLVDNTISVGQTICIPQKTPTPTPQGYEQTQASQRPFLEAVGPVATATYIVKDGDDVTGIRLQYGITLQRLCQLNEPYGQLNCGTCDFTAAVPGCRPTIVIGQTLFVPGPTPTPTITPTLTGSETATPTPGYAVPLLLSPALNKTVNGSAQLMWMPTGVLNADEYYLVEWTDMSTASTLQMRVKEPTLRLPAELQPADGTAHTINWRVVVARDGGDSDILLSPISNIFSFVWASR
ncbi:MAG: LysM peptidoglycan-binding domain-containing protein [Anaerolineae bacterium]|nr:LysM peptidoglycan-binding domain-containing protein [Anaerolineae bacterium]